MATAMAMSPVFQNVSSAPTGEKTCGMRAVFAASPLEAFSPPRNLGGFFVVDRQRPALLGIRESRRPICGKALQQESPSQLKCLNAPAQSRNERRRSLKLLAQLPNHEGGEESRDDASLPELKPNLPSIPYGLITGLASVGFLETAYLTWVKITGGSVTCPIGAGCNDVLDSSYAYVLGVPLALVGMVAYGSIAFLSGNRLLANKSPETVEEDYWVRWFLLGGTTAMAVSSAYFMYILTTKLGGASCAFCVGSALLSFSLLFSTLPGFTFKDVRNIAGLQLAVAASVVVGLSVAFGDANSAVARQGDIDLPPVEPEVVTVSTDKEINLAKHLQSIGAKMYGAFWCSHCYEQKQMFGREAMKHLEYVECYPDGYRKGVQLAKACDEANIQGFPTWIIKGQTYTGEQAFEALAQASGYDLSKLK